MMPKRLILAVLLSQSLVATADKPDDVITRSRAMIEEGERLRGLAEDRFRKAEIACYDTFFVNNCLDRARRTRMEDIQQARELELGGKRLELEERRRVAAERQTSIDMRSGREAPKPAAVSADEKKKLDAELATLPAAEREARIARDLAERLERRVREIQEQGAAATRALIAPPPAPKAAPAAPQALPLTDDEAARIRQEREKAAAEAAAQPQPAAPGLAAEEAERIRAEREAAAREAEARAAEERARRDAELERLRLERESALPPPAIQEPAAPAAVSDEEAARIRAERDAAAREAEARASEERALRDAERARLRGEQVPAPAAAPVAEPAPALAVEPVAEPAPSPAAAPLVEPATAPVASPAPEPTPAAASETSAVPAPATQPTPPAAAPTPASLGGYLLPETKNPPVMPGAPKGGPLGAEVIPVWILSDTPQESTMEPLAPLAPLPQQ